MLNAQVRSLLVVACIVLGVLLLVGATYQGVATALERRRYPHPGQLVDVGGHQLHLYCLGDGTPVVVLEAPEASMSEMWGWVQPEVARTSRVCSYDRAGLGWSEAGDRPYDPGRVPEELHALLTAREQPPPFVLAGHSLGASFVRRFASVYPHATAGLVLIAPAETDTPNRRFMATSPWLARAGLLRATGMLSDVWSGLPPASAGAVSAFLHRPDHLTRAAKEVERRADAERLGEAAPLPDGLPVTSLRASLTDERDARRVSRAIVEIVEHVRAAHVAGDGRTRPSRKLR